MKVEKLQALYLYWGDRPLHRQHPESSTPEAWFGYKIMLPSRILSDLKGNICLRGFTHDYQHSLGLCYPYNHMKGELQEQLGDYRAACHQLCCSRYAAVSDSVRVRQKWMTS